MWSKNQFTENFSGTEKIHKNRQYNQIRGILSPKNLNRHPGNGEPECLILKSKFWLKKAPKQNQTTNKKRMRQHQKNQKQTCEVRRGNTWLDRGQIRSWRLKKSDSVAAAIIMVDLLMELILNVVQVPCVYTYTALYCSCGSWAWISWLCLSNLNWFSVYVSLIYKNMTLFNMNVSKMQNGFKKIVFLLTCE